MKTMLLGTVLCLLASFATLANASQGDTKVSKTMVARGKYLVVQAGQCQDCHTPRDGKGRFIQNEWLKGATVPFKPIAPIPGWAVASLPIAGLPSMSSDADAVAFFRTGKHLDGREAAPPMPSYRFNKRDAEAIVAYLKSLGQ